MKPAVGMMAPYAARSRSSARKPAQGLGKKRCGMKKLEMIIGAMEKKSWIIAELSPMFGIEHKRACEQPTRVALEWPHAL